MARRFSDEWVDEFTRKLEPLLSRESATVRLPASDLFGLVVGLAEARGEVRALARKVEELEDALLRHDLADTVDRVLDAEDRARARTPARPLRRRPRGAVLGLRPPAEAAGLVVPEWSSDD